MVNAVKGTWVDDHTFVVDWRFLGLANSQEERWTLTFEGERIDVMARRMGLVPPEPGQAAPELLADAGEYLVRRRAVPHLEVAGDPPLDLNHIAQ